MNILVYEEIMHLEVNDLKSSLTLFFLIEDLLSCYSLDIRKKFTFNSAFRKYALLFHPDKTKSFGWLMTKLNHSRNILDSRRDHNWIRHCPSRFLHRREPELPSANADNQNTNTQNENTNNTDAGTSTYENINNTNSDPPTNTFSGSTNSLNTNSTSHNTNHTPSNNTSSETNYSSHFPHRTRAYWTPEDLCALQGCLADNNLLPRRIVQYIPSKTVEQIKNKLRHLKKYNLINGHHILQGRRSTFNYISR